MMSSNTSLPPSTADRRERNERLGRLAASCAIAVLGTIPLENSCGQFPAVIVWWFVFVLGSGLVLNSRKGEDLGTLAKYAILPALVPMITYGVLFLADQAKLCVSFPLAGNPYKAIATVVVLPLLTWLAIVIFSFGRVPALTFARWFAGPEATVEHVEKIGSIIRSVVTTLSAAVTLIAGLGKPG